MTAAFVQRVLNGFLHKYLKNVTTGKPKIGTHKSWDTNSTNCEIALSLGHHVSKHLVTKLEPSSLIFHHSEVRVGMFLVKITYEDLRRVQVHMRHATTRSQRGIRVSTLPSAVNVYARAHPGPCKSNRTAYSASCPFAMTIILAKFVHSMDQSKFTDLATSFEML